MTAVDQLPTLHVTASSCSGVCWALKRAQPRLTSAVSVCVILTVNRAIAVGHMEYVPPDSAEEILEHYCVHRPCLYKVMRPFDGSCSGGLDDMPTVGVVELLVWKARSAEARRSTFSLSVEYVTDQWGRRARIVGAFHNPPRHRLTHRLRSRVRVVRRTSERNFIHRNFQ